MRLFNEEKGRSAKKCKIAGFKKASQTINLQTEEIMTDEIEKVPKEKDNLTVIVGDWVLVKYAGNKINHEFYGHVIETR